MSAIISQLVSSGGKFTPELLATALQMAALSCPPYSHFWYPILDKLASNPVIKTIIDQLFWRPLLIAYTFVLMNILKVRSFVRSFIDQRTLLVRQTLRILFSASSFDH